jgi:TolB protein
LFNFPGTGEAVFFGAGGGDITALAYTPIGGFYKSSRVAFMSNRAGNDDVFVMEYDGSKVTNLTSNSANDDNPFFTADGTSIYFDSNRGGSQQLYRMAADGTAVTKITKDSGVDSAPCISSDGRFLAFLSLRSGNPHVYVSDPNGYGVHRITSGNYTEAHPDISPDTTRICFVTNRSADARMHIWTCNPDGTGLAQVTSGTSAEADCRWSPDGQSIVFRNQLGYLYTINPDGTGVIPVVTGGSPRYSPCFTPDGQKIVFSSDTSTGRDIFIIKSDGTGTAARLTNDGTTNDTPVVSGTQATARVYVGSAGADRGKNPAFGTSIGAFIASMALGSVTEVLALDAAVRANIYAESRWLGDNSGVVMVAVSGAVLTLMLQDNGRDIAPTKIVGTGGLIAPGPTDYEILFDANTAKLVSVIPFTRGRAGGGAPVGTLVGGRYVFQGQIAAAIDMKTKRNLAPNGATEVAVDPATGEIRDVR